MHLPSLPAMRSCFAFYVLAAVASVLSAHDGHSDRTYELSASAEPPENARLIELEIRDHESGAHLPARFSIELDGQPWTPATLNEAGIRFTSIHARKKQRQTVLYSRGIGAVRFAIPENASELVVHVAHGLHYRAKSTTIEPATTTTRLTVQLDRMVDLASRGWHAADTHLHYERRDPRHDSDWLTMLGADGLSQGFFMVLQGGNFDDVWAQQYAYGKAGEGSNQRQILVTGEEFRGPLQGHNNLLGLAEVITPISIGGMGTPSHRFNTPSTDGVLRRTRELGGIGGPAHGGTFGKASTAIADALNGASEFFELANTHLFETGPWYRVMNCGMILPPVAGTDLPNFPYRDSWQPFFGEVRTFVQCGEPNDFALWKQALRAGRAFISSGPLLLNFTANGTPLGERITLSTSGGDITIEAEVISSLPLESFEIIRNGQALAPVQPIDKSLSDGIHRWKVRQTISVDESCWLATRAFGPRKELLFAKGQALQKALMHSAAIPVRVGDQPIRVEPDVDAAVQQLREFQQRYRSEGQFPDDASRDAMLELFDAAITSVAE